MAGNEARHLPTDVIETEPLIQRSKLKTTPPLRFTWHGLLLLRSVRPQWSVMLMV